MSFVWYMIHYSNSPHNCQKKNWDGLSDPNIFIRISRKSDRLIHKININKRYTCTYTTKGILSTNSNYKTSRTPVPTHGKTFKSMEEKIKIKGKEEQGSCDDTKYRQNACDVE